MKRIIVFEGLDKSGKSTLIDNIRQIKKEWGYYQDPYSSEEMKRKIEDYLQYGNDDKMYYLKLLVKAKEDIVFNKIMKDKRDTIVLDRFTDSTYVYQGVLQNIDKTIIDNELSPVLNVIDDFIILKVFVDIKYNTFLKRSINKDYLEKLLSKDRFELLRNSYLYRFENCGRCVIINNDNKDIDQLTLEFFSIKEKRNLIF